MMSNQKTKWECISKYPQCSDPKNRSGETRCQRSWRKSRTVQATADAQDEDFGLEYSFKFGWFIIWAFMEPNDVPLPIWMVT